MFRKEPSCCARWHNTAGREGAWSLVPIPSQVLQQCQGCNNHFSCRIIYRVSASSYKYLWFEQLNQHTPPNVSSQEYVLSWTLRGLATICLLCTLTSEQLDTVIITIILRHLHRDYWFLQSVSILSELSEPNYISILFLFFYYHESKALLVKKWGYNPQGEPWYVHWPPSTLTSHLNHSYALVRLHWVTTMWDEVITYMVQWHHTGNHHTSPSDISAAMVTWN